MKNFLLALYNDADIYILRERTLCECGVVLLSHKSSVHCTFTFNL